jgi:hypothetical protein
MPRIEQKTLADLGRPDYSFYLFDKNPFRIMPVAIQEPAFLTDRDYVFRELRRAIETSLHDRKMQGRMLIADFGMGKSHILKYIRRRINLDLRQRPGGSGISAYAIPGKSMLDLYVGVVEDLSEEFLIEVSSAISRAHPEVRPEPRPGMQYELWRDIAGRRYYVPEHVNRLWQVLPRSAQRRIDKDYFAALIFLQDDKHRDDALYWLQGGSPLKTRRDAMGISSLITRDTAERAFVSLVEAIRQAEYSHFYLCLDEMEKLTYLSPRLQSEYFEQLRHVIDQLTEGLSIFGAVTPDAWQVLEDARHAFQSRLRGFPILELPPMSPREVIQLVSEYMAEERVMRADSDEYPYDQVARTVQELSLPVNVEDRLALELFPFSPSVIKAIAEQTRGNPRDILKACAWLIDSGYDQQRVYYDIDETLELLGLQQQEEVE